MVMNWTNISEITNPEHDGSEVELRGWIYRIRSSKKMVFIVLRDSTGIIQCVASKSDIGQESFDKAVDLTIESSLIIGGIVQKDDRAPGGYELHINRIEIISPAERFPITKDQSEEFLRDNRHLWIRSRRMNSIMKIRSTVTGAIHEFFSFSRSSRMRTGPFSS